MAKTIYTDAFGNEHELDDEITLLGPNPDLTGTSAEAFLDHGFQRIRDPYGDRQRAIERQARSKSGYSNPVDDPEYREKFWPGKGTV